MPRSSDTYEDATVEDEHHHFEEPGATHGGSWLWRTNTRGARVSARKPLASFANHAQLQRADYGISSPRRQLMGVRLVSVGQIPFVLVTH